ncbi:hypothetical protein [uncultured Gammaproteobacteria bacterium]|nr:hypothetical protein [uncultured Gammaproteobacteria bacterium]
MNDYFEIVDEITCFDNSDNRNLVFKKNHNNIVANNQKIYSNVLEYKKC